MKWEKARRPPEEVVGYPTYSALPPSPPPILVIYPSQTKHHRSCLSLACFLLFLLLIAFTAFLLWPRKPQIDVSDIQLQGISLHTIKKNGSLLPTLFLNVGLSLDLQIVNPNLFGIDYDLLTVHILYRGNEIAVVNSKGGRIPARSIARSSATLNVQGLEILRDIPFLLLDMAENRVPLDTVTVFAGTVDIFSFRPYAEITLDCHLVVNPSDNAILDHNCFILGDSNLRSKKPRMPS